MRFALSFLLLLAGTAFGAEPKAKPNVILIVSGYNLGPRDLGCGGSTYYKTPHLDAFSKKGVRLEEAYSPGYSDVCSMLALESGVSPERLHHPAPKDPKGSRGYSYQKLLAPHNVFSLPKNIALKQGAAPSDFDRAGYARIHSFQWDGPGFRKKWKAVEAKPIFATVDIVQNGVNKAKIAEYKPGKLGTQGNPDYAAAVEEQDEIFGEILKTVDELSNAENTVVVFTSTESGRNEGSISWTSNAPYREGHGHLYEGGLRVAFLIRGPGISTGGFPMIAADIVPTLAGLCGIEQKAFYDGADLSAQFRGKAKHDPMRTLYWHVPLYPISYSKPGGAIRVGNMKLIEYSENDRRELFDLSKDIGESRNLAAEKPEVVKDLAAKLAAWRKEIGAKLPTPNPDYRPNPQAKDGTIMLHARTASVTGTQLRFEPAPHKNTLGYWTNAADTARFEFTVTAPGTFTVSVLQGAGKGSGGAEVELAVGESKAKFTVKDTGGFQAFERREIGELTIEKAGRHTLTVTAKSKPGVAVMDLREVVLSPKR